MEVKSYKISDIAEVSSSPGIYAWYGTTHIGSADLRKDVDPEGRDHGARRFRESLARHTSRFSPPPLSVSLKSGFRDGWHGYVNSVKFEEHVDMLSSAGGSKAGSGFAYPDKAIDEVLSTEQGRAQLNNLIMASVPIFSAPLYIGKSVNLRNRLAAHVRALSKFSESVALYPDFLEKIQRKIADPSSDEISPDVSFAVRAVSAGFSSDHLRVYTLEIEKNSNFRGDSAGSAAEALEWLLNTWNRPILGRE